MTKTVKHSPQLFQKNLEKWFQADPKASVYLPYLEGENLSFCQTNSGELNLKYSLGTEERYFHSNDNAREEAQTWFSELKLDKIQILYVYGVGLGYYYEPVKEWLKKDSKRALVFLEDDLNVLYMFLQTSLATKILDDPQVQLCYFTSLEKKDNLWDKLYWDFILTQMHISALQSYAKYKEELFSQLHHKIIYDASIKNALVEEYLYFGVGFFRNFYLNMLKIADSYFGNELFGKFLNVPAIICGAGPSLSKQLPLLNELHDKAIIFAGGSALNALSNAHILPHFGAGIDPNPTQYYRLSSNYAFEVPMFYRNRMLHDAFMQIHGHKLYISGSGGYDISDWFEEKLGIRGQFIDEGHNVVNLSVELASALGCNPIIFIGMDLAYTEMQAYAKGIVKDASVTEKELLNTDDFDTRALLRKDVNGNSVYTLWKWIAEANWIGDYAASHPEIAFINSTEGGIGFPGIPNISFEESVKHLVNCYDIRSRVHGEIQNSAMPQVTHQKVRELMEELLKSLETCSGLLNTMIQEVQRVQKKIKTEKQVPAVQQTGLSVLCETELAEEPGYIYLLDIFNEVYSRILNRELVLVKKAGKRTTEWSKVYKKQQINLKRLTFLKNAADVNITIIQMALEGKSMVKYDEADSQRK